MEQSREKMDGSQLEMTSNHVYHYIIVHLLFYQ